MVYLLTLYHFTIIGIVIFQIDSLNIWAKKNELSYNMIKQSVLKYIILDKKDNNNTFLLFKYS